LLLLLDLGELGGDFGATGAYFAMMTKFTSLSEVRLAHVTLKRLLARVRVLVLLLVLLQAERFCAEAALQVLLRVVLLVVPL